MRFYLKYDLRAPGFGPLPEELCQACVEQCVWGERHGFSGVRLHERHASDDGYLPSPVVMGSVIAGATRTMGGSSIRAARQAARIADGFDPVPHKPVTTHREECARLGKQGSRGIHALPVVMGEMQLRSTCADH